MDKKPINVTPINALGIRLPQHPFATRISGGCDAYRLFDPKLFVQGHPFLRQRT
jgi:hypothetical protein